NSNDPILREHVVGGNPVLPGVAQLEMARAASELAGHPEVTRISEIVWMRPIQARRGESVVVSVGLTEKGGDHRFELFSEVDGQRRVHSQGRIHGARSVERPAKIELERWQNSATAQLDPCAIYAGFANAELCYGPGLQPIRKLWRGVDFALAELCVPAGWTRDPRFKWSPALLDGALQSIVGLPLSAEGRELNLPFSVGNLIAFGELPELCYALVR